MVYSAYNPYIQWVYWDICRHNSIWIVENQNWGGPMLESRTRRENLLPAASLEKKSIHCPSIVTSSSSSFPRSPYHTLLLGVPTRITAESTSGKFLK